MKTQLQEIKAKLNQINKQYCESKGYKISGDMDEDEKEESYDAKMGDDHLYMMIRSLGQYVMMLESDLYRYISNHSEGHLPPIQGAGKMEKAMKTLGISEDYDVRKPVVYASDTPHGAILEVEYKKK